MNDTSKLIEGKKLTELEKKLLTYILENMDVVLQMGVRKIAKANFTSPATIIRLSKKLGYKGFIDLYYNLLPLVSTEDKKNEQIGNSFFELERSLILQHNSEIDVNSFIDEVLCLENKSIFIYAAGFSAITAEYLHKKLLLLGKQSIISTASDSIGVFENNLQNIGAFVVISKSGETQEVIDKVQMANESKVYTVSFTKETSNRLESCSDLNFKITDQHKLDSRNLLPNTFYPFTILLIEYLLSKYLEKINERETGLE